MAVTGGTTARPWGLRPIHGRGAVFEAEFIPGSVVPELAGTVFAGTGSRPALVRFSQAFGLTPLDFVGLAIKLPDVYGPGQHQDFIMVSSSRRPVIRRLPVPMADLYSDAFFTSGTSYATEGGRFLLGAVVRWTGGRPWQPALGLPRSPTVGIRLLWSRSDLLRPGGGWRLAAELVLRRLWAGSDLALRFNPATTGDGLRTDGLVNLARSGIYRCSQHRWSWPAARRASPAAATDTEGVPL